jgi:HPt (histidine-containing phosphotransfer) domain-containing protein/HAMP domain-containing protein
MSVKWKLILPVLLCGLAICAIVRWMTVKTAVEEVRTASTSYATVLAKYIGALRVYYTKNVVAEAKKAGLKVTHSHQDLGAIPLPATMVHEMNSAFTTGIKVRLFSPFPFPWRKDSGLHNQEDAEEWRALNAHPDQPVSRILQVDGQPVVRFASADRMVADACVSCHNTHPDSPKLGWKVGDVRGVLQITIPIGAATAAATTKANNASLVVLGCVAIALLCIILVARKTIFVPLAELSGTANRIAEGDFQGEIAHRSSDEMGTLADAFRKANTYLQGLAGAVDQLGRGTLEREVEPRSDRDAVSINVNRANAELKARSQRLKQQNEDMRLVLDNVSQGFLTVEKDGTMAGQRSAILDRWFPAPEPSTRLWEYIGRHTSAAGWMEMAWEQIWEGVLPPEFGIDQLPKAFKKGEQHFAIQYSPIYALGPDGSKTLSKILVIVTDQTSAIARERAEGHMRELMHVFDRVMNDKSGFLDFVSEVDGLVQTISRNEEEDFKHLFRMVHTIKGSCGVFGVTSVAAVCHELETELSESQRTLTAAERQQIQACWSDFSQRIAVALGERSAQKVELEPREVDDFLAEVVKGAPRSELARRIVQWKYEPLQQQFERIGVQAVSLARRLGKGELEFSCDASGLKLPKESLKSFWLTFIHAVRNAIDHGLETPEERTDAGKPANGKLSLTASLVGESLRLRLQDDGRGIQWEALAEAARNKGLPHATRTDLLEALFSGGLSSRTEVSETSGRGVGMSAVRAECLRLTGELTLDSELGRGTTLEIVLPSHNIFPGAPPHIPGGSHPTGEHRTVG